MSHSAKGETGLPRPGTSSGFRAIRRKTKSLIEVSKDASTLSVPFLRSKSINNRYLLSSIQSPYKAI